ncbi:MAG: DUF1684 domain-containing protein [Spirosomataceae bacterium]
MQLRSLVGSLVLSLFSLASFGQTESSFREDLRKQMSQITQKTIPFYDEDSSWVVSAKFRTARKKSLLVLFPTSTGEVQSFSVFGRIYFIIDGKKQKLTVFRASPVNPLNRSILFIPFRDATNGIETYEGGRYLQVNMRNFQDGFLSINFNQATHPICVHDPTYSCPIVPKTNTLSVPIRAGEKLAPSLN